MIRIIKINFAGLRPRRRRWLAARGGLGTLAERERLRRCFASPLVGNPPGFREAAKVQFTRSAAVNVLHY